MISPKYGFLDPTNLVSEHAVSFEKPETRPISYSSLCDQFTKKELDVYDRIVILAGQLYVKRIRSVLSSRCSRNVEVETPFVCLGGIGYIGQRLARAVREGQEITLRSKGKSRR